MATRTVVIVADKDGMMVIPGILQANRNDVIKFGNLTDYNVTVQFTDLVPFDSSATIPVGGKNATAEETVKDTADFAIYRYDVTANIGGETVYAHASRPKIIIHDMIF